MSCICCVYIIHWLKYFDIPEYWLKYFDIPRILLKYFDMLFICCVYIIHILTILFCQGHDSAPGLYIMLLKQQHFSVSGQAADLARQHPPVEYVYRSSHPLIQFLPQKLAEWIANNYAAELNVPPRPDQSRSWSTATLNWILQTCIILSRLCSLQDCLATIPPHPFYIGEHDDNYDVAE
jgi:hypothetical protein